ncbi:MAG TPA: TetR family transcriptional regulator [Candidatus Ruania gallistercoris]|uniref:TetR family transcriptional regulator n=1 Tax=Candidatus Ruania gallistercoris TaxID=2838746 RepID=A0A9D2J2M4_9MICO|nr:TetR family transcriptional regulator [Candidatus Ruania gallistercoris]
MGRRDDLLAAALLVLAEGGLKGLTHRAVDARAGLPSGSAANLFRTRQSLLRAVIEEMERQDWGYVTASGDSPEPHGLEELAQALAEFTVRMVEPDQAPVTRARLELSLAFPDDVRDAHARLLARLVRMLASSGIDDPHVRAAGIAALLDGTILHALTVAPEPVDPTRLAKAIRALL